MMPIDPDAWQMSKLLSADPVAGRGWRGCRRGDDIQIVVILGRIAGRHRSIVTMRVNSGKR